MKMELLGERLKIRHFKLSDVNNIYENIKDEEIAKWMDSIPYPYKKIDALKFIIKNILYMLIKKGKNEYSLGLVLKKTDKVIGEIKLSTINWKDRSAQLMYWVGKKYWNKGFISEGIKLIQKFGFEELKLYRIYARTYAENIGSKKVLEKNGFKLERINKKSRFKYSQWHDDLIYGKTISEYNLDSSINTKK